MRGVGKRTQKDQQQKTQNTSLRRPGNMTRHQLFEPSSQRKPLPVKENRSFFQLPYGLSLWTHWKISHYQLNRRSNINVLGFLLYKYNMCYFFFLKVNSIQPIPKYNTPKHSSVVHQTPGVFADILPPAAPVCSVNTVDCSSSAFPDCESVTKYVCIGPGFNYSFPFFFFFHLLA